MTDTETDTYADVIDLACIGRNWPEGRDVPKLIVGVANLMAPWSNGISRLSMFRFDMVR